ncbi:hypothetical protein H6F95_24070 [Cyanobacteria bacterium FACHB-471]|nr:hypothetical protein [Cyanobacteria bacterium FACHB-471]
MTQKLTGTEVIMDDVAVYDFWSWAYSDLLMNIVRGAFAEYLVGLALELTIPSRQDWEPFDFCYQGKRIEVKSSAFIQSWQQKKLYNPAFSIKKNSKGTRESDFYIFCLYSEQIRSRANPLRIEDWKFWVAPTPVLKESVLDKKNVSLRTIESYFESGVSYSQLRDHLDEAIKDPLS